MPMPGSTIGGTAASQYVSLETITHLFGSQQEGEIFLTIQTPVTTQPVLSEAQRQKMPMTVSDAVIPGSASGTIPGTGPLQTVSDPGVFQTTADTQPTMQTAPESDSGVLQRTPTQTLAAQLASQMFQSASEMRNVSRTNATVVDEIAQVVAQEAGVEKPFQGVRIDNLILRGSLTIPAIGILSYSMIL
jgi:hypothetical protein